MDREPLGIDIEDIPGLGALVEEMLRFGQECELRRNGVPVAALRAVERATRENPDRARRERELFLSARGGWADSDADEFVLEAYRERTHDRPPVTL